MNLCADAAAAFRLLPAYYILSSWPLMVPLSGKRASALLMVLICCFLCWSSRLCSKSVEADRGSPSLTRTTKANRITDIIHSVHEAHTAYTEHKARSDYCYHIDWTRSVLESDTNTVLYLSVSKIAVSINECRLHQNYRKY